MAEHNLLHNGEFAREFAAYRHDESKRVPTGWAPWWVDGHATGSNGPTWQNNVPAFDSHLLNDQPLVRLSSPFATHTAGLFQQTPAVPGEKYELNVDGQAWSSEAEEWGVIRDASDVNLQIGLDPTGGTDATSPIVVWSKASQPVGKWETLRLVATAEANIITIFLKSAPQLPKRQQAVLWRRAVLRPVGRYKRATNIVGPGDTHIYLDPERPHPPTTARATASAQRNHPFVDLRVIRPNGEPTTVLLTANKQADGRYIWEYEFAIEDEGLYDIRLVGDGGARFYAQRLVKSAREVQIVPSGRPRLDYKRVYVLLPPTADEAWMVAAARGSFVGRYSIGFSADDGGLGEVAERVVIGVNPHHWPETLTSTWYLHNYPGTRFIPLVANKPEELEAWLNEWVDQ